MAKAKYKDYDEAEAAQKSLKIEVKNHKQSLTSYLKQNKLKRNVDHSDDKKHGKKITAFNKKIERAVSKLEVCNQACKDLKPKKERAYKYDYPDGLTAEEKKKFRQKARQEANPKKKKDKKDTKKDKKTSTKKEGKKTSSKKGKGKKKRNKKDD